MNINFKTMAILFSAIVAGLFTSCTQDGVNTSNKGTVKVLLTDAPFPSDLVAEANVTIDKIEIRMEEDTTASDTTNFVLLSEETQTFNLLDLQNGVTTVLATAELGVGTYNQIRMHVADAGIVLTDGTEFALKVPSGASSGLKINIKNGLTITEGGLGTMILDFDVSRSFVAQGNVKAKKGIKGFIFKPVIRATAEDNSGNIEGTVSTGTGESIVPMPDVAVNIIQAEDTVTTAITDENGFYSVIGLTPGTYIVATTVEAYDSVSIADVAVEKGETTVVDINLMETAPAETAGGEQTSGE